MRRDNPKLKKLSKKARLTCVHLATFGGSIPGSTILNAAATAGIAGLTAHIFTHQVLHYHRNRNKDFKNWNKLVSKLKNQADFECTETWDALLFAIGKGDECTCKYKDFE